MFFVSKILILNIYVLIIKFMNQLLQSKNPQLNSN
jgi:hypothetical protein